MSKNFKKIFIFLLMMVSVGSMQGQTKIGTHPEVIQLGSVLELESLSKGLRLPRIQLDDVNAWTLDGDAVSGMLIFNAVGAAPKGMYYWSMELSQWVRIVSSAELASMIISNTKVSVNSIGNKLSISVNGITDLGVDIINNNSLSIVNGVLISSVNGVVSSPGLNLISSVNNGLSSSNGNAQLGGPLIKPTTISTSPTNTLAITGLQNGNVATDSLLMVAAHTGVVRKISTSVLTNEGLVSIVRATLNGQRRFATPASITNPRKIQVYRNGITVEFDPVDAGQIEIETEAACYVGDEVKIIQSI